MSDIGNLEYTKYRKIFSGYRYPLAFVDLNKFWTPPSNLFFFK